jgi:hypothetical protein
MIDIETFGTKPTAVILKIAAVCFNISTGKVKEVFKIDVDADSCIDLGCSLELDTINWWLNRTKEEQQTITHHKGKHLSTALCLLENFISNYSCETVNIWGNSARFDLGILAHAYSITKKQLPWKHYNELDLRTIVWQKPSIKKQMQFEGIKHDPVADCKHQIKYLVDTLNAI